MGIDPCPKKSQKGTKYGKEKRIDTRIVLDNNLVHTSYLVTAKLKQ